MEYSIKHTIQISCGKLARFYYDGRGVGQDYDKAFQYFKKDCDLGGKKSCAMAGSAYYLGKGTKEDLKLAKRYYEKACEMSAIGCNKLGAMYEFGDGVPKNLSKAKEYYGKSCDWDYQNACDNYKRLNKKVRDEKVNAGNEQKALCSDKSLSYCINHYDKQCEAKSYGACFNMGNLYRKQRQYNKAKKYYEMVCDKANSEDLYQVKYVADSLTMWHDTTFMMGIACSDLARFYYNGLGVERDYDKALKYNKKACDLDWADSCGRAGNAYYFGEGTKKDLALAKSYFEKSCKFESDNFESGIGCGMLGAMYHNGEIVPKNLSKAKELYGKACDLDFQMGCVKYKELNNEGVK